MLRRLAEQVGATAHLADGVEAQAVAVVEPSWTDVHVAYRVGSRHQVGAGAAGRAVAPPVRGVPGLTAASVWCRCSRWTTPW